METKIKIIDKHMCRVHFCLPYKRVDKIRNEIKTKATMLDDEMIKGLIYTTIENNELENELLKKGIVCFGEKNVHYLSPISENHPVIGVATFLILPEVINLSLPMSIPSYIYEEISKDLLHCDEDFKDTLIDAGMFFEEKADQVTITCDVCYDLQYTKNGKVLNTIKNQRFDLFTDDDLDPSLFIGAKVGDKIIIDQQDVNVEAIITNIFEKYPYTENNYEKEMLDSIDCKDFNDMYQKFCEVYKKSVTNDAFVNFIVEFTAMHTELEITNDMYEFYKNKEVFPYYEDYFDAANEDEKKSVVKKSLIFDLLVKMIELKTSNVYTENLDIFEVSRDLGLLYLCNEYEPFETSFELAKRKILNYCKTENIVKGIE